MKTHFLLPLLALTLFPLAGQENLIKNGDFTNAAKTLVPECRTNGGKVSLFMEEYTWNKCGKLEIDRISTDKNGKKSFGAAVWIGGDNFGKGTPGFPCKPDTTYQFSVDVRGTASSFGVRCYQWKQGAGVWSMKTGNTTFKGAKTTKEWSTYKGSFKTGHDAASAALVLSLWGNEIQQRKPLADKIGDYILFDNVKVWEKKNPLIPGNNAAAQAVPVKIVKIASTDNCTVTDFKVMRGGKPEGDTKVVIRMDKENLLLHAECSEPEKVTTNEKRMWNGDDIEFFFAWDRPDGSGFRQFAVTPLGQKYLSSGSEGEMKADWSVKIDRQAKGWTADLAIPLSLIGGEKWKDGETVDFNIARLRMVKKERISWGDVQSGFADRPHFGRLLKGAYSDGMTRQAYEEKKAKEAAAAQQAKLDSVAKQKLIAAPVGILDDFSIPFLPDALFEHEGGIKADLAVNEMRSLPVAVMNNTDKITEYKLDFETAKPKAEKDWNKGDSVKCVTLRQAVRIRDSQSGETAIYDPLPKMNEAGTFMIPPRSTALLWLDINTRGMTPGVIQARLRLIPLNGACKFTKAGHGYHNYNYEGEMKDIPVTLNIRNIVLNEKSSRPSNFYSQAPTEDVFKLESDVGEEYFLLSPWTLFFPLKNGKFEPVAPKAEAYLKQIRGWGAKKLFIGYAVYYWYTNQHKKHKELFGEWVKTLQTFVEKNGFRPEDCMVEIADEPDPKMIDELVVATKTAKEMAPRFKLFHSLGAHIFSAELMKKLHPYTDHWCNWRYGYFTQKEHLDFMQMAKREGRTFSHYTCSTNVREGLDNNFRKHAWFGEYHQLQGNDMYQAISSLYAGAWKGFQGNALLYFDGETAVPSIRYMAVRQGINDIKYLDKLREVGKNSPEAQAFLKTAAKRVLVDFGHDPQMADKVREEAAQLILKLQK